MEKQLKNQKGVAKLGKKLEFDKIDWQKTIKSFNSYKPENRIAILETIPAAGLDDNVLKPNPDWVPHYPIIIRIGGIIIIIYGPTPIPKYGPCFTDMFDEVLHGKDTIFSRFSNKGVQHLVMDSPKNKIEIIADPVILKNVSSK